jgi:hypothetical protein
VILALLMVIGAFGFVAFMFYIVLAGGIERHPLTFSGGDRASILVEATR